MTENGTATNTADLLNKLRIFLTSTLPVAERWTQLRYTTLSGQEELIVQGNGAGSDTIICGLKHYFSSFTSNSEFILQHFSSFSSPSTFEQQLNGIPQLQNYVCLPCINSSITYWFIGNSRCFKIITKIGTNYYHAYLGFIYPYTNPIDWPNPICIGGSGLANFDGVPVKYNQTSSPALCSYWTPKNGFVAGSYQETSTLMIKNTNGSQRRLFNRSDNNYDGLSQGTWPYLEVARGLYGSYTNIAPNLSNQYHLIPIIIVDNNGSGIYGEFEGVRFAPPVLLPEDTIIVGSETWICFPNITSGGLEMVAYRYV